MNRQHLVGACAGVALLCSAASAMGWCRTTTCDPTKTDCGNAAGCATEGYRLYWPNSCVSFSVQQDGSALRGISYETAHEIITNSYLTWVNSKCGGGSAPSIRVADHGPVICSEQRYNQKSGNANIWMFRDEEWPYQGPNATLALTTVTFNTRSGEIYDVDVEINAHDRELTTGDSDVNVDLQSVVTHEIGHFFGLAHSQELDATMFASYNRGDTHLRDLSADDVAGLCAIYPSSRKPAGNNCEPRHGFTSQCTGNPIEEDDGGCSIGARSFSQNSGTRFGAIAAVLGSLIAFGARFRGRRSRFC